MLKWLWRFLFGEEKSEPSKPSVEDTPSSTQNPAQFKNVERPSSGSKNSSDALKVKSSASNTQTPVRYQSPFSDDTKTAAQKPPLISGSPARLEAAPASKSSAQWVPAGTTITVADYTIPGGMLYVGNQLPAIRPYGGVEPSLINPQLRVDRINPDYEGSGMNYWPSYSEISPACRAAYLEWLKGNRCDPDACIGYVFLFFYGLERRVFRDLRGTAVGAFSEMAKIIAEVERLLTIYGRNSSFNGYARRFVEVCNILIAATDSAQWSPPLSGASWELPLDLKVALSQRVTAKKTIPADWALAWYVHLPEVKLRTPALRCSAEFQRLFRLRYEKELGQGLLLTPSRTKLQAFYQPASASMGGAIEIDVGDLSDVTASSTSLNQLQILVDRCTDQLEPYSRWLGRNPEDRGSRAAIALLPPELVEAYESEDTKTFRLWLEKCLDQGDQTVVAAKTLLHYWQPDAPNKLVKADAILLSQFLEKRGYGIEPDLRFGGKALSTEGNVVVFRLPTNYPETASAEYTSAALLLHLAVAIASADSSVSETEQAYLEAHLETALALTEPERRRLRAHLKWLLQEKLSLRGLKTRLEAVAPENRMAIAQFLICVAGADGHISPKEITILAKIWPMLDLDPQDLYSHIHHVDTASSLPRPATQPVTVRPASSARKGFAIPTSPSLTTSPVGDDEPGFTLDSGLIEAKKAESAAVAAILNTIFVDDELPLLSPPLPANGTTLAGLDAAHSAFVHRLSEQTSWNRSALEQVALDLGLMIDGALEIINESVFDKCEELLIDGDDPIEVDLEVLKEFLS